MIKFIALFSLILLFLVICLWFFVFFYFVKKFKSFSSYLESIDDLKTLEKIGGLSHQGKKVIRNVPFPIVHKELIRRFSETKNEEYIKFDRYYIKYIKLFLGLPILGFFAYILYLNFS